MNLKSVPRIPTLDAVAISTEAIKESGRSKPIAIQCASISANTLTEYIVKLYGSLELGQHSIAKEIYASILAYVLGLNVPDPAIINIPQEFINAVIDPTIKNKLQNSPGENFGSKTIIPPTTFRYITESLLEEAVGIYAFDMLIRNPDRRVEKPNMFQFTDQLVIYDHESAFYYSRPELCLGGVTEPWEIRNEAFVPNHILYSPLKKRNDPVDFSEFVEKLEVLSDDYFDRIIDEIPISWQTPELSNITNYIKRARDNADLFMRGLQETLA